MSRKINNQINPRVKNRIQEFCDARGITPYRLSQNIHRSKSVISMYQSGQRFPDPNVMVEMCDELGCSLGELFYVVGPEDVCEK